MAEVTVKLNNLRIAPRKVRLVIDLVRGKRAAHAMEQLTFLPKRAALPVRKLLASAIVAAKDKNLEMNNLGITRVTCDQGPALKRRRINSRGRASMVKKMTSHITLTLTDVPPAKKGKGA